MLVVVKMLFQRLVLYFFSINNYIYCVINHRICIQSYIMCVELVDGIYGVYVDGKIFHPLGTSPMLWFVPSATNLSHFNQWLTCLLYLRNGCYHLWCNKVVMMHSLVKVELSEYNLEFQCSIWNLQKRALFMNFYPEMPWNNTEMH